VVTTTCRSAKSITMRTKRRIAVDRAPRPSGSRTATTINLLTSVQLTLPGSCADMSQVEAHTIPPADRRSDGLKVPVLPAITPQRRGGREQAGPRWPLEESASGWRSADGMRAV
jgi:hypothetical protein